LSQERLSYLLQQLLALNATEEELQELEASIHADEDGLLMEQIPVLLNRQAVVEERPYDEGKWNQVASVILRADKIVSEQQQPAVVPVKHMSWKRWAAVAAVLLVLGTGSYLFQRQQHKVITTHQPQVPKDVPPGSPKAVLVMADGSERILDETNGKSFTETNGTTITNKNGLLQYNPGNQHAATVYNTLRIPAAGQYQLLLPDGSKVWLNAASSITFPTTFTGKERRVEVTGEAYFEIAANARQPFIVKTSEQEVTVLGTQFNINAYADEPITRTTLLQGSIKVASLSSVINHLSSPVLRPGQQSQLTKTELKVSNAVNVEEAIAWKNGYFQFEDASLAAVMRQLARWYDITVVYEGKPLTEHFDGKMQRSLTLVQVLKNLEKIGVHYTLEGKTLTLYAS
jgi:predicted DNA-binding protein (MmcQ/YjbR family)